MKLVPVVAWRGRDALDQRLVALLRAIRERATLGGAARAVGLSYRGAWGLLAAQNRLAGGALVVMERGRGARLSQLGERLVAADEAAARELARLETRLAVSVTAERLPSRTSPGTIRLQASHDLLLAAALEGAGLPVELAFKGSLESLAALAQGEAEMAGFHVSARAGRADDLAPVRRFLDPRRHRLIRFAAREQGIMVAKGNPARVRSLADVVARRLVFVNRQRGSGTRLLLDQALEEAGRAASELRGYANEEFTHRAVAATVAAGRADAGFGVKAAAADFGLDFVPIRSERYWIALRARDAGRPAVARLIELLGGREFRRLAARFPGYDARRAGESCAVAALDAEERR